MNMVLIEFSTTGFIVCNYIDHLELYRSWEFKQVSGKH